MSDELEKNEIVSNELEKNQIVTLESGDDNFMNNVAKNLIQLYKTNEEDKSNYLKYYGLIVTILMTIVLGIFKINFSSDVNNYTLTFNDYISVFLVLLLLFCIGLVILKKLFAVRKTSVNLSIELGNVYSFFTNKYSNTSCFIGQGFKLIKKSNDIKFINYRGSDFFTFFILQTINTIVLFFSFFFLIKGLQMISPIDLTWILYICEALVLITSFLIFKRFEKSSL